MEKNIYYDIGRKKDSERHGLRMEKIRLEARIRHLLDTEEYVISRTLVQTILEHKIACRKLGLTTKIFNDKL